MKLELNSQLVMNRRTVILLIILLLLLIVTAIQYWVFPKWHEYKNLVQESHNLEHQFNIIVKKIKKELTPEKREQALIELELQQRKLGDGIEIGHVLNDLVYIEQESKANITILQVEPLEEVNGYFLEAVILKAKGSYAELITMIQGIEELEYFTKADDIKITTEKLEIGGKAISLSPDKLELEMLFYIVRSKDKELEKIDTEILPMEQIPFSTVTREVKR